MNENNVTTPIQVQKSPKGIGQKKNLVIILGVVFLMTVMGVVAHFLGIKQNQTPSNPIQPNQNSVNPSLIPAKNGLQNFVYYTVNHYAKMYGGEYATHIYSYNPNLLLQIRIFSTL